jgi:hypothetical protein
MGRELTARGPVLYFSVGTAPRSFGNLRLSGSEGSAGAPGGGERTWISTVLVSGSMMDRIWT